MILSILICTIEGREDSFDLLFKKLQRQLFQALSLYGMESEILFECDNKELSIGAKRQKLLDRSVGTHVVFIDDDDDVNDNYIGNIIYTLVNNLSCDSVGFKIECNMQGKKETAIASNKYSDWCENKDGFKYCRTPYHKTPIRREIALKIGYKDMRFGEDYDYSKRLKESGLIKNEHFINEVMYFYNYKYENPKTKYGITE